jgi:aminoglycoside phosphotransferase family enzyme/predicted kinase
MDDQREVIAFLADGASHGAPDAKVEQIATHCSIVFLLGEQALKLKRAVRFSYLDYSTVSLREKYCRAELRLNRRTAPGIYRRVRAITREAPGKLAFDGAGAALDWVLEMRRFDEATLFDRLAEARRLTPELMRALADGIAEFHGEAEPAPGHGGAAALARAIAIDTENLRLAAPPLDRAAIDALDAASLARLAKLERLLDRRRAEGKVRRGHGDLHLRNICLFEGRPTLFDAIEFNDDFACIDVLYDLAFLLMDLLHRGLGELANLVCNRYLDRTGETAGLPALPLFLSTRAAIRAHVLGALARSPAAPAETVAAAQSYLALAAALLTEAPPRIIAVGGLSGSGKSSLGQALAALCRPAPGARLIRSDVLRKRLAQVPPETSLPRESYTLAASRRVYAALEEEARLTLAAGYTAILDATFLRAQERQAAAALAQAAGVSFIGLWLDAPHEMLAERLDARRNDASDADRAVLEWQRGIDTGPIDWRQLDTSAGPAATVAAARAVLGI